MHYELRELRTDKQTGIEVEHTDIDDTDGNRDRGRNRHAKTLRDGTEAAHKKKNTHIGRNRHSQTEKEIDKQKDIYTVHILAYIDVDIDKHKALVMNIDIDVSLRLGQT